MLMCIVSENTKVLISILGTLVGALILDVLLLYGIHNVSSYFCCVVLLDITLSMDFRYRKLLLMGWGVSSWLIV
jgi:hypothetical protein